MKLINLTIVLIMISLLLVSCNKKETKNESEKTNIVFIMADDMGWSDLPIYGNKFDEAPNISNLANEGMMFTDAYAACPVCSPTRASIQSGQHPARVGIIDFIPGHWRPYEEVIVPKNRTQFLPNNLTTLPEMLKSAGYTTGYFGKWHLGFWPEHHPSKRGYDIAYEYKGGGFFNSRFSPHYKVNDPKKPLGEVLTDMSIDFIEANKDTSFFLMLSHYDVHVQLDGDSATIRKYLNKEKVDGYPCNAIYATMVEEIDKSVGRVMAKLDEAGLSENTIIVFFSDNGGLVKRFDEIPLIAKNKQHIYKNDTLLYVASSNAPLRAEKGTVYEGGIREPLIVKWPGKIKPGTKNRALVSSVDLYPTFAEVAGIELPSDQIFDGKSIIPELTGKAFNKDRALFWHYPVYHHDVPKSVIRKGDWKLIENLVDDTFELYNLKNDIGEKNNLIDSNKDKAEELKATLKEWKQDIGARNPTKNPNFDPEKREQWVRHPGFKNLFKKPNLKK